MKSKFKTLSFYRILILSCCISMLSACGSDVGLQPQEHLDRATQYFDSGDLKSSIIELKNALQKDTTLAGARWMLGQVNLKMGDGFAALDEINKAENLGFSHPDLEALRLQALIQIGRYQQVLEMTTELIADGKGTDRIFSLRGDAYYDLDRYEDALASYQNALAADQSSIDARIGLARYYIVKNKYKEARSSVKEAIKINENDVRVWILLGNIEMRDGNINDAGKAFTKATSIESYNIIAQLGLARTLLINLEIDKAKVIINTVIGDYPNSINSRYLLAYIEFKEGDLGSAEKRLRGILKTMPAHPESLFLLGNILYEQTRMEEAISALFLFLGTSPKNLQASKMLAVIYLRQAEPQQAINVLEKVVSIYKGDSQLISILGSAYMANGELEKGADLLAEAVTQDPESANLRTQLAIAHLSTGTAEKAKEQLETAIALDPGLIRADVLLILTYLKERDYDAAINAAARFTEKHPENLLALNLLGSAYLGKGETNKAREKFNQALVIRPGFTPAMANLAKLELLDGNIDSARKKYLEILEIDETNQVTLLSLANMEGKNANRKAMAAYLQKARFGNPYALQPRLLLAIYFDGINSPVDMLEVVREAYELVPTNNAVLMLMGRALRLNGNLTDAKDMLQNLISQSPSNIAGLLELSRVYALEKNTYEAKKSLNKLLTLQPDHIDGKVAIVGIAIMNKNFVEARNLYEDLVNLKINKARLDVIAGDIELASGVTQLAIEKYQSALSYGISKNVVMKLSKAYLASGDSSKANAILLDWADKNPDDIEAMILLAASYFEDGNTIDAARIYKQILAKDPSNVFSLNNLAWIYQSNGNPKALEIAEKAYQLAPEKLEIVDTFGWVLINQDQIERGIKLLEYADALSNHESPDILYHLAFGLAKSGETDKAMDLLKKLLKDEKIFLERNSAEELLSVLQ